MTIVLLCDQVLFLFSREYLLPSKLLSKSPRLQSENLSIHLLNGK